MALANYSDLLSAAANWSARADLTSRIPEFIVLAEAKMNRRLREKNSIANISFPIGAEYVPTPANFGGVKTFYLDTDPRGPLNFMPDALMTSIFPSGSGKPTAYNVQGNNFRFAISPDAAYAARLVYYLKVPALTTTYPVNWVITDHPDAYVYGVMAELCGLTQDFAAAKNWVSAMYGVIDEIKTASNRDAHGGDAALAARPG